MAGGKPAAVIIQLGPEPFLKILESLQVMNFSKFTGADKRTGRDS